MVAKKTAQGLFQNGTAIRPDQWTLLTHSIPRRMTDESVKAISVLSTDTDTGQKVGKINVQVSIKDPITEL